MVSFAFTRLLVHYIKLYFIYFYLNNWSYFEQMTQATSREKCQPSFRVRYKRTTVHLIPIDALSLAMQFSISVTHVSNLLSVKQDKKGGPRARNSPLYTTTKRHKDIVLLFKITWSQERSGKRGE